jgi:hypothetical protein
MTSLATNSSRIAVMSEAAIEKVRVVQNEMLKMPQVDLPVHHTLHGGMYSRSLVIPAGVAIAGAFILVPTMLIVSGNVTVYANDQEYEIDGYQVLVASAGRKQLFVAHSDTNMTMLFATTATNVEDAEDEFTSESHLLASRRYEDLNTTIITGE